MKIINLKNYLEEDYEELEHTSSFRSNKVKVRAEIGKKNRKPRIQMESEKLSDKRQKSIKWL